MTKTFNLLAAASLSLLTFNIAAIAQDVDAKTGHVTLNKRCDVSQACSAEDHAINTKGTGTNNGRSVHAGKKDYVGHVTLNKRTAVPQDPIPGCGPTQYGNPTSSTC